MKPLKLTLTGFKGIQAGMGLETFTLDLAEYSTAQLVAIVAPNGRGKTTVLDNLQPYRLMPSKIKGANYSPEAFSYFDHIVAPGEASKELIWEHQGETYRSLLEWKVTAKTQSASAYLQYKDGENWQPVTLADGTSSDGKAKTYDRCVEGILGSPRLYFTAAFSAQGRSQLSSYGQGDIKGLMSEVLGLHRIQELGAKAAEVTKGLNSKLADRRERLQELDDVAQQAGTLRDAIAMHARNLSGFTADIERHRQAATQERLAVADMQREQQDAEELRARRANVQNQIDAATREYQRAKGVIEADIRSTDAQHLQTMQRLNADVYRIEESHGRAEKSRAAAEQLLARREEIEQAAASIPGLDTAIEKANNALTAAQAKLNEAQQAQAALRQKDQHLTGLADAGRRARESETDLLNRCALTKEVPCQGTDLQGRCRLLSDAVEAEQKLPAVRADIIAMTEDYRAQKAQRDELATQAGNMAELQNEVAKCGADLQKATDARTAAMNLAAQAGGLAAAAQALEDARDSIRASEDMLAELADQKTAAGQMHAERITELELRAAQAFGAHQDALARLQTELDRIPAPGDDAPLLAAQQRLAAAEAAEQKARDDADRTRGAIATAEGRLSALEESLAEGNALAADIAHLDGEISHWSLLQKALGRDGILALSIDDAGPTLASLANDLLLSCYGPRFSVRIDTQETVKSTGAQKETFDVIVFDSESDTSKSVADMSGGEKIWINEALTRAIALYQAQSSGQTFHTLFSDESDGALDAEKKGQFVRMKRRVLELGGYGQEFFISHSPDVWPLADAVIHL